VVFCRNLGDKASVTEASAESDGPQGPPSIDDVEIVGASPRVLHFRIRRASIRYPGRTYLEKRIGASSYVQSGLNLGVESRSGRRKIGGVACPRPHCKRCEPPFEREDCSTSSPERTSEPQSGALDPQRR